MSNLSTVKAALDAEIQHANKGIAFYAARITAIENLIEQLDRLGSADGGIPSAKKAGKRSGAQRVKASSNGTVRDATSKKSAKAANSGRKSALPKTGGAFWQSLLSDTPISNQDLLAAAVAKLAIQPGPAELKKLKQRLANAVTNMTKDGSMRSEGSGRARRFTSGG